MRTAKTLLLLCLGLTGHSILAVDAESLFNLSCASCHGKDGHAKTPIAKKLGVKDLTESKLPDEGIRKQILEGKLGKDGKPAMPPFKDKISGADLDGLIEYVKRFRK